MQVFGMDFRGHGGSDKPHASSAYGTVNLADDVVALMDHLRISTASLVGYSLGSVVALHLLYAYPALFKRSVLIATGDGLLGLAPFTFAEVGPQWAHALGFPQYPEELPKHVAMYWNFATKVGGDREAAAAAASANYPPCTSAEANWATSPVLVVSGERDPVLGQGPQLAQSLPRGRYLEIPGADHFMLAVNEQAQTKVINFIGGRDET